MKKANRIPFEDFKRTKLSAHSTEEFWACVDEDGNWEDSSPILSKETLNGLTSDSFRAAVNFVAMNNGLLDDEDATSQQLKERELEHMDGLKCSIIHSSMFKKMYEAGVIEPGQHYAEEEDSSTQLNN